MIRENQKVLLFASFSAIVIWSLLAWKMLPCLLGAINPTEFWPRYSVGFAFSILIGGAMIGPLVSGMQGRVSEYVHKKHKIHISDTRPFDWFPAIFAYIEQPMYTSFVLLDKYEFIWYWLLTKMAARWALSKDKGDSRHRYYPVLVGTLLSVTYGVTGAKAIQWGSEFLLESWSGAIVMMVVLVLGTWLLTRYESCRYESWKKKYIRMINHEEISMIIEHIQGLLFRAEKMMKEGIDLNKQKLGSAVEDGVYKDFIRIVKKAIEINDSNGLEHHGTLLSLANSKRNSWLDLTDKCMILRPIVKGFERRLRPAVPDVEGSDA